MRISGRHPRASERDLARLADGTLDSSRREAVERSVAASGELQSRLRDQRRAIDAVRRAHGRARSAGAADPPSGARSDPRARSLTLICPRAERRRRRARLGARRRRRRASRAHGRRRGDARRPTRDRGGARAARGPRDASEPRRRRAPVPLLGGSLRLESHGGPRRRRRRQGPDHGLLPQRRPADRLHDRARHPAAGRSRREHDHPQRGHRSRLGGQPPADRHLVAPGAHVRALGRRRPAFHADGAGRRGAATAPFHTDRTQRGPLAR